MKSIKEPYIGFKQENSIEFQLQSVYLIYTWLIICAILNLVYFKEYEIYVLYTIDMWYDIAIPELSMPFCDT